MFETRDQRDGRSGGGAQAPDPGDPWPESFSRLKRAADVVLAAALFVLLAPLLLLLAAAVVLTSRGPVIYAQERTGRRHRRFTIYKFRTMGHDCERLTGPRWSTADDPRVTPVGRFLRKTHLDELPQLWNILRGDMSLVGPRPERPEFVAQLEKALPQYADRLLVRPGLTGLAQVQLPPDVDADSVRRKLLCDLDYVERAGMRMDLLLVLCTALSVIGVPLDASSRLLGLRTPGIDPEPAERAGELVAQQV